MDDHDEKAPTSRQENWTTQGTFHRNSIGRNASITAVKNQRITAEHHASQEYA